MSEKLPLVVVLEEAVAAFDDLTYVLKAGGYDDLAGVSSALLRDTRSRLRETARCLESGCGRELLLQEFGDALVPVRCERCPMHPEPAPCAKTGDDPPAA